MKLGMVSVKGNHVFLFADKFGTMVYQDVILRCLPQWQILYYY